MFFKVQSEFPVQSTTKNCSYNHYKLFMAQAELSSLPVWSVSWYSNVS